MHPYINIGIKVARLTGKMLIRSMLHLNVGANKKKSSLPYELTENFEGSLIDLGIDIISKAYPAHNVQSKTIKHSNNSEITWLIDPLNGSLNYWYGIPWFAISVAILNAGSVEHGVIYNPILDELFVATKGSGARLNDKRIRVSSNSKFKEALLAIDSNLLLNSNVDQQKNIELLPNNNNKIVNRDFGCPALQLAFVATGRLDGYCDHNLDYSEIAAGALIVKEAGGYVTDWSLQEDQLNAGKVVAGNPKIYTELLNFFGN